MIRDLIILFVVTTAYKGAEVTIADWLGAFIKAQCVGGRFDFYFYFTE